MIARPADHDRWREARDDLGERERGDVRGDRDVARARPCPHRTRRRPVDFGDHGERGRCGAFRSRSRSGAPSPASRRGSRLPSPGPCRTSRPRRGCGRTASARRGPPGSRRRPARPSSRAVNRFPSPESIVTVSVDADGSSRSPSTSIAASSRAQRRLVSCVVRAVVGGGARAAGARDDPDGGAATEAGDREERGARDPQIDRRAADQPADPERSQPQHVEDRESDRVVAGLRSG